LWPDLDKLDEINRRSTFIGDLPGGTLRKWSSSSSVARVNRRANPTNERALMDDAPRPSFALPRGRGRGSVRKRPHRFCPLPPKLSRPACEGCLWIYSICLRPVWIEVNEKSF
jgi:hypothetical protein